MTIAEEEFYALDKQLGDVLEPLCGSRVLITGAGGFLGKLFLAYFAHLNRHLTPETAIKVIAVDNGIVGETTDKNIEDANIRFIDHDITLPFEMRLRKDEKIDYIISGAGLASPFMYAKYPLETLDVSYLGTRNLLLLAYHHQVKSILLFSSSEIYATPPPEQIPTPESYIGQIHTLESRSCYDVGKLSLETLGHVFDTQYGVPCKIVRPFNLYAYVSKNDSRVLPNFIKKVLRKEPLEVYGKDSNTRTFCYSLDGLQGFLRVLLLGRNGQAYNIGNDKPEITMYHLAKLVTEVTGSASPVNIMDYPQNYPSYEPSRRCPDLRKARTELNYEPQTKLEDGIVKFYLWAKENWND